MKYLMHSMPYTHRRKFIFSGIPGRVAEHEDLDAPGETFLRRDMAFLRRDTS